MKCEAPPLIVRGTCLEIRQSEGSELYPVSTMQDLHLLIRESDKVLSF